MSQKRPLNTEENKKIWYEGLKSMNKAVNFGEKTQVRKGLILT